MDPALPPTPFHTTLMLLSYVHAPIVGSYYLGACMFSLCTLQKAQAVIQKRKLSISVFMLTILVAYIIEVLYYLSCSIASPDYTPPHFLAIRCLGSILVWSPLLHLQWSSKLLRWHAYFGAFLLQFALETSTWLVMVSAQSQQIRQKSLPLLVSCVRAFVSLLLLVDSLVILVAKQADGSPATSTSGDNGTINQDNSIDVKNSSLEEDDKDIKAQQDKRLEEEAGWFGYWKDFMLFLPDLFPTDDRLVMACFVVRLINVLQKRFLNLLTPRQFGIITNELQKAYETKSGVMPWKDISLWVLYTWINSHAGFGVIDSLANMVISNSVYRRVTSRAHKHVLGLSMDFHTSKDSGEVLKAVEQVNSLNSLVETVLFNTAPIFLDLSIAIYYVTHLFNAYMAFIILFIGAAYIAIGLYFTAQSQPKRRDYVETYRMERATVNETVHNWQTVAYFNRVDFECERHLENLKKYTKAQHTYYTGYLGGHATQSLLTKFGFASACVFGIMQIVTGQKPVSNLVTLIMYWGTVMSPLYTLSSSYKQITNALIDTERLVQLLNTKPSVADQEGAKDIVIHTGEVEFKNVDFYYDKRKPIIKGITLKALGGQTIAFVGETGGGKSTLLKLLFRFYDVAKGSITIDGQDLRLVTQASLRDAIGLVPQDPVLFNQTIRQNLCYGKLNATDAEIEDACRAAAIHDDILGFPDGYNSKVGERGIRLSGGQLQRIAIARVLLKDPKIVMLDEATSAIDSSIETIIQQAFRKFSQGRTTFVIAHRLSTIVDADQILVVEKGEIIERGRHQELVQNKEGKYAELWKMQTAGHLSKRVETKDTIEGESKGGDVVVSDNGIPGEDKATSSAIENDNVEGYKSIRRR